LFSYALHIVISILILLSLLTKLNITNYTFQSVLASRNAVKAYFLASNFSCFYFSPFYFFEPTMSTWQSARKAPALLFPLPAPQRGNNQCAPFCVHCCWQGGVKGVAWVKGAGCSAQLPLQLIENTKFPLSRRQIIWQLLERACLAFILKLITPAEILHFA